MLKYGEPLEVKAAGELKGHSYLGRKYEAGDRIAYVLIHRELDDDRFLCEMTTISDKEEAEFFQKYEVVEGYGHREFPTFKEK